MSDFIHAIVPNGDGRSARTGLRPGVYSETTKKGDTTQSELFIQDAEDMYISDDPSSKTLHLRGDFIDGRQINMDIPYGRYQSITVHGARGLPATEWSKLDGDTPIDLTHSRQGQEVNRFNVNLSDTSGISRVSINGGLATDTVRAVRMPEDSLLHVEGHHYNTAAAMSADSIYVSPKFSSKLKVTCGCTFESGGEPAAASWQGTSKDDFVDGANPHAMPLILRAQPGGYQQIQYGAKGGKPVTDGTSFLFDFNGDGSYKLRQLN